MRVRKFRILVLVGFLLILTTPHLWAAAGTETEEVGYDDLVQRLSEKTKKNQQYSNSFEPGLEALQIHANFGFLSSLNAVSVNGSSDVEPQNGFQLGLGINLFSPHFVAMGVLRNLGETHAGAETRSLREFDLNMVFKQPTYHLTAGLGTRYLQLTNPQKKLDIDDTTPVSVLAAGLDTPLNEGWTLIFELGWRSAIVNSTADKNSVDLTVGLESTF